MEKHFTPAHPPPMSPRQFELRLEYAALLADYRKLAAVPFSDAAFGEMLKIVTRMEGISEHIEQPMSSSITEQFSMLDCI